MTLSIGTRVSVGDVLGTVRWRGVLPGLDSERVGVELDVSSPDRHDGSYQGSKVFDCEPGCGVFVKQSKIDLGISCEAVVHDRYLQDVACSDSNLVGREKVLERFSDLRNIQFACLEKGRISSAGNLSSLLNLRRMRLTENLISSWSVVYDIVSQLPLLDDLDLTGNKVTQPNTSSQGALPSLKSLSLCRTGLSKWDAVLDFVTPFTNLEALNVEGNGLTSLTSDKRLPLTLKSLDCTANFLSSWQDSLCALPPHLHSIDLSMNRLVDPREGGEGCADCGASSGNGDSCSGSADQFSEAEAVIRFLETSEITQISLVGNKMEKFDFIRRIADSKKGPTITALRITDCPFYTQKLISTDLLRHVILASFPSLVLLNGAPVTKQSLRLNAERYCATSKEVMSHQLMSESKIQTLRDKHNINVPQISADSAGSYSSSDQQRTASSSFSVKLVPLEMRTQAIEFKVMPNLSVADFKRLIAKRGKWPLDLDALNVLWKSGHEAGDCLSDSFGWESLDIADSADSLANIIPCDLITVMLQVKGKD